MSFKSAAVVVGILVLPGAAIQAGDYLIEPQFYDHNPRDGFMDPGSALNPYILKDRSGNRFGTIQSDIPDFNPGDRFLEPGSFSNPYRLRFD